MILHEKEIVLHSVENKDRLLEYLSNSINNQIYPNDIPVRFVITHTEGNNYHCELGLLSAKDGRTVQLNNSIFDFKKRGYENTDKFTAVLLIPTGIGAEIGGHSGDAGPVARLLASSCDTLITHPNVVNASDINELPENGLYVEGSIITRLLMGTISLQRVRANRVIFIIDKHEDKMFYEDAINSMSAARASLGLHCPAIVLMENKMRMHSLYSTSGRAVGKIDYFDRLCDILAEYRSQYDAIALSSIIRVPVDFHERYFHENIINPWGGVEAMLTHAVSLLFDVPSAHSPMLESRAVLNLEVGVVDPRKAAEAVSTTFLHSIFKGLYKSPRIISDPSLTDRTGVISASDVSCMIIPDGCVGLPTIAAIEQDIPVIAVQENKNRMKNRLEDYPFRSGKLFIVDNYLEAVGVMNALKAGVSIESVRRPLKWTNVTNYEKKEANVDGQDILTRVSANNDLEKRRSRS